MQDCGEYIAKNEGVAILLQLCNAEKPTVLRFVSVALANMCAVPSIQKILVEVYGYDFSDCSVVLKCQVS